MRKYRVLVLYSGVPSVSYMEPDPRELEKMLPDCPERQLQLGVASDYPAAQKAVNSGIVGACLGFARRKLDPKPFLGMVEYGNREQWRSGLK